MDIVPFVAEWSTIWNRNLVDIERNNIGASRNLEPDKL
jgi:hypothetical protein